MRVLFQMSPTDSGHMLDAPAASKLGAHRALFPSEEQNRLEKFRPYGIPKPGVAELSSAKQLGQRPKCRADRLHNKAPEGGDSHRARGVSRECAVNRLEYARSETTARRGRYSYSELVVLRSLPPVRERDAAVSLVTMRIVIRRVVRLDRKYPRGRNEWHRVSNLFTTPQAIMCWGVTSRVSKPPDKISEPPKRDWRSCK